ncbi:hypothetical protein Baya_5501 [Bagarius yarrelli]|uniref:Uncharacterized protein n=1 Tax=Bagarius yarrelli TaxID=175774 RepID=A0A556TUW1_BAGYA|nr:hypothetical protein Baya_5501 [Bagarius yarrelli]
MALLPYKEWHLSGSCPSQRAPHDMSSVRNDCVCPSGSSSLCMLCEKGKNDHGQDQRSSPETVSAGSKARLAYGSRQAKSLESVQWDMKTNGKE